MTGSLDRVVERSNDLLTFPCLSSLSHPLVDVLPEGLSSDGHLVTSHQSLLNQESHDAWKNRPVNKQAMRPIRDLDTYWGYLRSC
jgi:hypothetical protein